MISIFNFPIITIFSVRAGDGRCAAVHGGLLPTQLELHSTFLAAIAFVVVVVILAERQFLLHHGVVVSRRRHRRGANRREHGELMINDLVFLDLRLFISISWNIKLFQTTLATTTSDSFEVELPEPAVPLWLPLPILGRNSNRNSIWLCFANAFLCASTEN